MQASTLQQPNFVTAYMLKYMETKYGGIRTGESTGYCSACFDSVKSIRHLSVLKSWENGLSP